MWTKRPNYLFKGWNSNKHLKLHCLHVCCVRTVRKRDATLRAGESLRSSLQLGSEEADYMEKFPGPALGPAPARPPHQGSHCTVTMSSSDSYDTLASFTQVSAAPCYIHGEWTTGI